MGTVAAFGKKRSAAAARTGIERPQAKPVVEPDPASAEDSVSEVSGHIGLLSRMPFLTFGLIAVLVLVFRREDVPVFDFGLILDPSLPPLVAEGGLSGKAVLDGGEWWRLFTAPLLHDGIFDLSSNLIALMIAGWIFERLIGRAWFAALFAISALGGEVGCLVLNARATVSTGASGAVIGLLAAAFVCSFIFQSEQLRKRMQRGTSRLLVPSLLPALAPFLDGSFADGDFGAPIGGAIAGAAIGYLLREIWPEGAVRPAGGKIALAIACVSGAISAAAFAFIAMK